MIPSADKTYSRLSWLDNAKMVAMLCVIAGHTGGWLGGWPYNIGGIIVAFNMPLFVLLSGYTSLGGLLRSDSLKGLLDYAEKTLWRMVVPAVCLSAMDQVWRGSFFARKFWVAYAMASVILWLVTELKARNYSRSMAVYSDAVRAALVVFLIAGSESLNMYWFLSMLLKFQLSVAMMILLGKWLKISVGSLIIVSSVLLWCLTYFLSDSWTFEMSAYFAIGLVMKQFGVFGRVQKMNPMAAFSMFVIGCILCRLFTIGYEFYDNSLNELISQGSGHIYPLRVLVALALSLAIIRWVYALSGEYNWFSKMGSNTLAFYTIHCLILDDFLKPYIHFNNPDNCKWIIGIMSALALTAVTYLIIRLCEQWIVTRRLVLGILK